MDIYCLQLICIRTAGTGSIWRRPESFWRIKVKSGEEADEVSRLTFPPHPHIDSCFYELFVIRGVRLIAVNPDFISCSFKDRNGNLAMAAIIILVGFLGDAAAYRGGGFMYVSTDMSISYISSAKLNDELEIIASCLGRRGGYGGMYSFETRRLGKLLHKGDIQSLIAMLANCDHTFSIYILR